MHGGSRMGVPQWYAGLQGKAAEPLGHDLGSTQGGTAACKRVVALRPPVINQSEVQLHSNRQRHSTVHSMRSAAHEAKMNADTMAALTLNCGQGQWHGCMLMRSQADATRCST